MRILASLACLSSLSLLAACGAQNGHYDANGNYIAPPNATTEAQRNHAPSPGGPSSNDYYGRPHGYYADGTPYTYDRRDDYDDNEYSLAENNEMDVPNGMFPPRGMCRVWFAGRVPSGQPRVESCDNIRSRVPTGAYVIYGG